MSIGPIYDYTANYKFTLVNYDFPRWQTYDHGNWTNLDAVLGTLFGSFGFGGVWQNGYVYNVNDRIIDATSNTLYLCLVSHTSASTGSFFQERDANPSYWRSLSFNPANRGNWAVATQYNVQDIVTSGSQIAICRLAHLSSSNFTNDVNAGYWSILIDVTGFNIGLALTKANNLSDVSSASTARTNLGLGTAATHASTEYLLVANNLSDGNATAIRTNLGLGTAALSDATSFMLATNNLSELINKGNARTNLGLGTLAIMSSITTALISDAGGIGKQVLVSNTQADLAPLLPIFTPDSGAGGAKGVVPPPAAGDAAANKFLNAAGGWSVPPTPAATPVTGFSLVSGLVIFTPNNTTIAVGFTSAVLTNTGRTANQTIGGGAVNINLANVGAGGVQTGLTVGTGWYSVYLIGNGSTVSAMLSDSGSTPTLPTGYTFYKRVGWVRTRAASNLLLTRQVGSRAEFLEAPGTAGVFTGPYGTHSGGLTGPYTYTAVAASTLISPTAGSLLGFMSTTASSTCLVSNQSSAGSPRSGVVPLVYAETTGGVGTFTSYPFDIMLIDGNLYIYAADSNGQVFVTGWREV